MQKQTPVAPPPINPAPGYEFLNNQPQKTSKLPGGDSKNARIAIVAVGVTVLIIIGVIIYSLLSSASQATKNDLITAVQQHAELIRISEIGTKEAAGSETKNLAITTNLSLLSTQEDLQTLATKAGANIDKQLVSGKKNEKTDKDLEQAKQVNQFDEAFTEVIEQQLSSYQQTLKRIHASAQNESSKATLSEIYNNSLVLTGQQE